MNIITGEENLKYITAYVQQVEVWRRQHKKIKTFPAYKQERLNSLFPNDV